MSHWIHELGRLVEAGLPAVLVTVAATRGSTPRAPGAHMIVTASGCHGTIGGGQLELRALTLARRMIPAAAKPAAGTAQTPETKAIDVTEGIEGTERTGATAATAPSLVRFPLGASVGQCCGGVVQLAFEPIGAHSREWVAAARALAVQGRPWGRIAPLGADSAPTRVFGEEPGDTLSDPCVAERARSLLAANAEAALLVGAHAGGGADALLDVCVPPELTVVLFGAGHVGRALVEVFGRLPMRVIWVDTRDDEFPSQLPDNVEVRCTDTPTAEVDDAPEDAVFLVLTHSHALDFDLVRAILDRGDFRFCGLIGSRSKRASFENRLRARGYAERTYARIACPIGVPGVVGKEPEVIAIAVAAEVLQLRGASLAARSSRYEPGGDVPHPAPPHGIAA